MHFAFVFIALAAAVALAGPAGADTAKPSLDQLIERFRSEAPKVEAEVRIDAWVEPGDGSGRPDEMVITLLPEGVTKLNADPGITVTPAAQTGVDWQVALPHRHQDMNIAYFEPPATVRMPFKASGVEPIELLVEYAYCLVDYQCFFGEETLSVALTSKAGAS